MARQEQVVEGLFMDDEEDESKIRKRGCSTSSASSSTILHNYRFKKAVLVGKRGGGSTTPVPSWRVVSSRSPSISLRMATAAEPPPSLLGRSTAALITQPVSARKLAATLWELNEVPVAAPDWRRVDSSASGSLPPHLSDPSHSPISERSDRSGTRTQRTHQSSSECRRQSRINANDFGILDSVSDASFMETETRSRHHSQAHAGSTQGFINNLKDVSNTLTTSKELLKIISRLWSKVSKQDGQPTTSTSLITALHTELERARLQVNQMVKEQRTDQSNISYLVKSFAEEKVAWKKKERQMINTEIESISEELEVERKLRRRAERLNKKLENELAETKAASDQLTDDNEAILRSERSKEKVYHRASINHGSLGFSPSEKEGEVEDVIIEYDDSFNTNKYRMERPSLGRSTPLLRSVSNGVDCSQSGGRLCEFEKQAHRKSCGDDLQRYKTVKSLRDQILCGSNSTLDGSNSTLDDAGVDTKNTRRSSSSTTSRRK